MNIHIKDYMKPKSKKNIRKINVPYSKRDAKTVKISKKLRELFEL